MMRVVGRGGASHVAPENTMASVEMALRLGFGFEVSVRRLKDGALVVLHDGTLERTMTAQEDRVAVYESRVLALESVDPYEAASRVSTLQSQLQASYAVTSRLANLSILNFMS